MNFTDRRDMHKLAQARLDRRFGAAGLAVLSPAVINRLLLAEAADIVMLQADTSFDSAKALIVAAHTGDHRPVRAMADTDLG